VIERRRLWRRSGRKTWAWGVLAREGEMPIEAARRCRADAVSILESDHGDTRGLLAMLQRPLSERARDRAAFVLVEDVRIHLQIEAEILYPALALRPDAVGAARTHRDVVEDAVADLERLAAKGNDLAPVARRILSLHDAHAAEEERHVFPHARRVLGPHGLVALGEKLLARRRELRACGVAPRGASVVDLRSTTLEVRRKLAR
jgi:hypothetical protein